MKLQSVNENEQNPQLDDLPPKREVRFQNVQNNQRPNESVFGTFCGSLQFKSLLEENANLTQQSVEKKIVEFLKYTICQPLDATKTNFQMYLATANALKQQLIDNWYATQETALKTKAKSVNYLSLEYLFGRAMTNALFNLKCGKQFYQSLSNLGQRLETIQAEENDAAIGNGGLGRLLTCFMDSLATKNLITYGYGIYYKYGMFKQMIIDNKQVEIPDEWFGQFSPFPIITREDIKYNIQFGGHSVWETIDGKTHFGWKGDQVVTAVAHDYLCPGYNTKNISCIRLWQSIAQDNKEFDLQKHFQGDYYGSIQEKADSENISLVLYPNDATESGKRLRLQQEYFFVSASIQDILSRAQKMQIDFHQLQKYFAIQLNDTHPALAIPELMRILLDDYNYQWSEAWEIVSNCISYTNHTVLQEALEKWSLPLFQQLLPRHTEIIYEINKRFLDSQKDLSIDQIKKVSIIDENGCKFVRMANLSIIGSHKVNGVAALHSEILKQQIFNDFYKLNPQKFINVTNGITPRRWLAECNPHLSKFITKYLKMLGACKTEQDWLLNCDLLKNLVKLEDNQQALNELFNIKQLNKQRLAAYIQRHCQNTGGSINPNMLFDTQVKRIHEYKRQQMNILQTIYFYQLLKGMTEEQKKETFGQGICKIFAGKAASAYVNAKEIIELINNVASVINNDSDVNKYLRVVFIPDYNVSLAEIIFPATELSEQISTCGQEASGTGNMKACLNSGVILGTYDGANVEIAEHVGEENIFIFGLNAKEVDETKERFSKGESLVISENLQNVFKLLKTNIFGDYNNYKSALQSIEAGNDWFACCADFDNYNQTYLEDVLPTYKDKTQYAIMMLQNTAKMGYFSSDRCIEEYNSQIWHAQEVVVGGIQ